MTAPASPKAADGPLEAPDSGGLDRGVFAVAGVVVLGAIMSILDVTVVNVALNALTAEFNTSLATMQWVATGYTLALATVIPITGWACARFGTKRLYMTSIALFVIGSMLAGAAWSAESLIAFRVLQGLGGGMIMPAGMTILTQAAGPQRVGQVMSVVGIPMLLGPITGPILGGWLVDDVSWRWIFFINLPIGIISLFLAARILKPDTPKPTEKLDLLGLLLLSPGLALLIYGLAKGGELQDFLAPEAVWFTVAGAALVLGFVARALTAATPLIDLRLLKRRSVAAASGTMVLFITAFMGAMLLMPLYFQVVRGESALASGLLLAPQGLGAMVTMPIGGRLTDKIGPGRVVLGGLFVVVLAVAGFTWILQEDTSYWALGGVLFVMGTGMGMTMMPTMAAAIQPLVHDEVPRASTMLNIIQQVSTSVGTAMMSVLLARQLADKLPAMPGEGGGEAGMAAMAEIPPDMLARIAGPLADAWQSTYWIAAGLLLLAFLPALVLPRRKPEKPMGDAPMPMH
ncbi:DHA2 family efflux MFS transporter permease subunit [Actinomadura sp. WMMB 499]|uniref:DHA2 family efflux MFS transporter permease subunit n=1 Tax=Actinomadura sp. WMMB 499 TaxID=1219491 RepID=UPI0012464368|nr:DHA2 family efflux MFS transporter permease subunit [Actinomadura sp. WMMB 499]QFG26058.1 DHA2 family efflux MFS transporter permease subunit [Actinomadura sp. WMMB 499]